MNEKKVCKNCSFPITPCEHQQCLQAHAQQFCGPSCREVYLKIKAYELDRIVNG